MNHESEAASRMLFHVSSFGAVGDGRKDDGPAIRAAFRAAQDSGHPATVELDKRVYVIGEREDNWTYFDFADARDLTIDGNGATLLMAAPVNSPFSLVGCRNVTLKRLVIDYEQLAFTQGDVVEVDAEQGTFVLRLHDGYADPPSDRWIKEQYGDSSWWWGALFAPGQAYVKRGMRDHLFIESVVPADGKRSYRVKLTEKYGSEAQHIEAGDRFVLSLSYKKHLSREQAQLRQGSFNGNIQIKQSSDILIEDVTMYASIMMSVVNNGNEGPVTFRRLCVLRKPGTDRLLASSSDGVHNKGNRVGPVFEQCQFESLKDDAINIGDNVKFVAEVSEGGDTVLLTNTNSVNTVRAGDELVFFNPGQEKLVQAANVRKVEVTEEGHVVAVLDRRIDGVVRRQGNDPEATQVYNRNTSGNGFIIRDCSFGPGRRHAMLIRASDGLICGNVMESPGTSGIWLSNESGNFFEGPFPRNVTIRANRIHHSGSHGIFIATVGGSSTGRAAGQILLDANTIERPGRNAIRIQYAAQIELRHTVIRIEEGTDSPIGIENSEQIWIDELTVEDRRAERYPVVELMNMEQDQVKLGHIRA